MVPALTNPFLREVASARETRSLAPREQQQHACSLNGHSSLRFHRHNKRAQNRTDPPSLLQQPLPLLTNGLTDGMDFLGLGSGLGWASGHAHRRRLLLAQQPPLRNENCCLPGAATGVSLEASTGPDLSLLFPPPSTPSFQPRFNRAASDQTCSTYFLNAAVESRREEYTKQWPPQSRKLSCSDRLDIPDERFSTMRSNKVMR